MGFGIGKGYHGDNRGFSLSTASDVTARINQKFTFDVAKGTIDYDKKMALGLMNQRTLREIKKQEHPQGKFQK